MKKSKLKGGSLFFNSFSIKQYNPKDLPKVLELGKEKEERFEYQSTQGIQNYVYWVAVKPVQLINQELKNKNKAYVFEVFDPEGHLSLEKSGFLGYYVVIASDMEKAKLEIKEFLERGWAFPHR